VSAREQYQEFLEWLDSKRTEILRAWIACADNDNDAKILYRRLLFKIQAEQRETERKLENLANANI
jgi:hypothetical protein